MRSVKSAEHTAERRRRLGRGRWAELVAVVLLSMKGYRVLARRHVTPYGEVDIIAARRDRIAFVEVKRRSTRSDAEAALTPAQAARIGRAADYWLARHSGYMEREVGLDAVLVTGRGLPLHILNALDRM